MVVSYCVVVLLLFFFFQAEDGIRYLIVTGVQTCALPIYRLRSRRRVPAGHAGDGLGAGGAAAGAGAQSLGGPRGERPRTGNSRAAGGRSEEHTSELQSRSDLVCRLLLEKKKKKE